MDVKDVFSILSNNKENISYSSFLFETRNERLYFSLFLVFGTIFLITFWFYPFVALIAASLSLLSLIVYTSFSFLSSSEFIRNPIKFYVRSAHEDFDKIRNLSDELTLFPTQVLISSKQHFEHESIRLKNKISFAIGSISKVGIFPSLLALFYAIYEYQSKADSLLPFIILGSVIGVYSGVLLIQRIISWQESCIYILEQVLGEKSENT